MYYRHLLSCTKLRQEIFKKRLWRFPIYIYHFYSYHVVGGTQICFKNYAFIHSMTSLFVFLLLLFTRENDISPSFILNLWKASLKTEWWLSFFGTWSSAVSLPDGYNLADSSVDAVMLGSWMQMMLLHIYCTVRTVAKGLVFRRIIQIWETWLKAGKPCIFLFSSVCEVLNCQCFFSSEVNFWFIYTGHL